MYVREVSMHLKANAATIEQDLLPLLRKQNGFADEITFVAPDGTVKDLATVVEGTPEVQAYEVANSTFHKIAARN